jgi:subtilisin family serine protease
MERFESLIDEFLIDANEPSNLGNGSTSRLKVAILDTGIDMNHDEIFGEERIKECKSWTGTKADEDASGHGTHIASTILNLTRNVDLYIAKVTESNVLEDAHHISDVGDLEISHNFLSFVFQPVSRLTRAF